MVESDYLSGNHLVIQKLKQMPSLELFDEENLQGALKLSKIREYEPGETILEEGSLDFGPPILTQSVRRRFMVTTDKRLFQYSNLCQ